MTRIRLLRQLGGARRRLRDVAAGAFATADAETRAASTLRDDLEADRLSLFTDAPERFAAARSVNVLLLAEAERKAADRLLLDAEQRRSAARKLSEEKRVALGRRESQLRTAERLLERAVDERDEAVQRDEQRTLDDLTAARARRDQ